MSSAVKVILGVSLVALAAGFAACDNGSGDSGPVTVTGGNSSTGTGGSGTPPGTGGSSSATAGNTSTGTGGSATGTGGGTATGPEGVPITPVEGWVAKESNALGIQGAAFSFADTTSLMGMTDNLKDATATAACIVGTAAKVDMASEKCTTKMFDPPAMDCYGQYWGAALGINMNQTIDPTTMEGADPVAYDASSIKGFYFEIAGDTVPGPTALRFKVNDSDGKEYCNTSALKLKVGGNTVLFSDLTTECWSPTDMSSKIDAAVEKKFIKIAWQVVTNDKATVPFNFCISNIRALIKDGVTLPPVGSGTGGSSSTGTGGSAPAAGGSASAAGGSAAASGGHAGG